MLGREKLWAHFYPKPAILGQIMSNLVICGWAEFITKIQFELPKFCENETGSKNGPNNSARLFCFRVG